MSSITDIQKVIDFFSFSNHEPLIEYKKVQYTAWLDYLKKSERYKNLKFTIFF
jgi:hypothetical protein